MIDPLILESLREAFIKEAFLGALAGGALQAAGRKLTESGASAALQGAGRAAGKYLAQSAGNIGAGMGVGGAAGGVLGAAHGAYEGYNRAPEEGGGTLGALSGALSGGSRGALIGSVVGGAAGLASGGRGSDAVTRLTQGQWNPLGAAARSGQAKLHSVTGLVPGGAARGTPEYAKALEGINAGGLGDAAKAIQRASDKGDFRGRDQALAAYQRAVGSAQAGQTSLAGLAQGIQQKGVAQGARDILTHGAQNAWQSRGVAGKGMMVAAPLGSAALAYATSPGAEGEATGSALGHGAAQTLTPFLGSAGGQLVGRAGSAVGGTVGKGIDQLVRAVRPSGPSPLGNNPAAPSPEPGLDSPHVEREYTNAALGKPPDNLQT